MNKNQYCPNDAAVLTAAGNRFRPGGLSFYLPLLLIPLLGISTSAVAKKPAATIQGVGFLCNDNVDCKVSAIRHAVEVITANGPVLLGVGASINSSAEPFPITPVLYSSAADTLFPLPAVDETENSTFLTASMITPDGLRIASRAHYGAPGPLRTAVIVDVNPGWPEFSNPTFTNTLLDPGFVNVRTAASNISDDGTVAYGFGSTGNFIWTAASGLSLLGLPDGDLGFGAMVGGSNAGDGSRALVSDFSCDENFTLCTQTGHVYDKATNSFTKLLPLEGDDSAFGFAMTQDGQIVAGQSYRSTLDDDVFLEEGQIVTWNASTGEQVDVLGSPDTTWYAGNLGGITNDGKAIIVSFEDADPQDFSGTVVERPYLLNKHGSFPLEDVLTDAGIDLSGWVFSFDETACQNCDAAGGTSVYGVSPDGGLIFGGALHDVDGTLVPEGYIVSGLRKNYLKNYKPKK